jgi:acetolactate synthase-1/2/3 large subunit
MVLNIFLLSRAILPIYDELYHWEKSNFKHILVRHEQSAAHAADAYSRATNKVGVCFAISGPGATNLVTGNCNASNGFYSNVLLQVKLGVPSLEQMRFKKYILELLTYRETFLHSS